MSDEDPFHQRLHHIASHALNSDTAQTPGMRRVEAVSGTTVGSRNLWMGQTHVAASTNSGNHHHGESETAIYVVSGNPSFVFLDNEHGEIRLDTEPGDYIYVPPWVPHREENPDPANEAVVVISRTTQDAIVVNVPDLRWVGPATIAATAGPAPSAPAPGIAPASTAPASTAPASAVPASTATPSDVPATGVRATTAPADTAPA